MNIIRQRWFLVSAFAFAAVIAGHLFVNNYNRLFSAQAKLEFDIRSVKNGNWSDPNTWQPKRLPKKGDRVLIGKSTKVIYDVDNDAVIRLVQVAGTLSFSREKDTTLNVGLLSVQNSEMCMESGFACTFDAGHHIGKKSTARLEIGTPEQPIPATVTAKIRLHYQPGMNKDDAPALVCCSAHMDIHGSPMNRTWVELGKTAKPGDNTVVLLEKVTGWKVGDEVIVTGSLRKSEYRFRDNPDAVSTEERIITKIDGNTIHLNKPLKEVHWGDGQFRSEVGNLSRSVVIESADPKGLRGHTVFHNHSTGAISYARFAHLGKEGVLGRYPIHYHLVGDSMRGSYVLGVAIVDSHNRWVTIHGTQYLLVRDCIGYKSVGHGFFLEDGTEMYNVLDRNLGVQAYRAKRLPKQVLPFDPNDGAAFWWANARNTLVRNVTCENEEYGYRYDSQKNRYFDSNLAILMPDGKREVVDIRTLPIYRFENNEAHTEGLYGMVLANNGGNTFDSPPRNQQAIERLKNYDWTGPDKKHPHIIKNLTLWKVHYAIRPQATSMWMENIRIEDAAYGVYRPAFGDHVYKNIHMAKVAAEPFNRGLDDASSQVGKITVDGLYFEKAGYGSMPLIQMTDNNLNGDAECHFKNVKVTRSYAKKPLIGRGGGALADPVTEKGVPYYLHDYFGPGRHAKVVSVKAKDLLDDGNEYKEEAPFTGRGAKFTEVKKVEWPKLLDPVDDLPPATIITSIQRKGKQLIVEGVSHDNGDITEVKVNGRKAEFLSNNAGVVDWRITVDAAKEVVAHALDASGNTEMMVHRRTVE